MRITGPTVLWTGATNTFVALGPAQSGKAIRGTAFSALAPASAAAASWAFPAPGASGPVTQGGLCLTVPSGPPGTPVTALPCSGAPSQQISLVKSANGAALRSAAGTTNFVDYSPTAGAFQTHVQDRGDGLQTGLLTPVGRVALSVTTVAKGIVGTATISGRATPGAAVLTGTLSVTASPAGTWSLTVPGISPAGATIRLAQSINGELYTHADAVVSGWPPPPTAPAAPTAEVTFLADVTQDAVVHGTGLTGAEVTIRSGVTTIGTSPVIDGEWSTSITALGAGTHSLTVTQSRDGLASPATSVTIDYGDAVAITSPTDGATVP